MHSFSRPRSNFTALHEFGHHLQQITPALAEQLGDQADFGRELEELTSDASAARVLLPDELVRQHLGTGTPTAAQIVELHVAGGASRAAACVAAAQQLSSPGMVILLDDYGIIDFVASYMMEFPLRGLAQTGTEIVNARTASDRTAVHTQTRFRFSDGGTGELMYAQAAYLGPFMLIVAVADKAPWETLSLSTTESRFVAAWHTCERCEHVFETTSQTRCEICRQPKCPECDWCACKAKMKQKVCTSCFTEKSLQLFDADSEICRDCLS